MPKKEPGEMKIVVKVPRKRIQRIRHATDMHGNEIPRRYIIDFRAIRTTRRDTRDYVKRNFLGEKPAFSSPEELQRLVDEYFVSCEIPFMDKNGNIKEDKNGNPIYVQVKPYTVSGLALHLGIHTSTFGRYASGYFDEFEELDLRYSRILGKARQKIESYAESRLYDKDGYNGSRFVLDSKFGWRTGKEQAEIEDKRFNQYIRQQELEIKKQLMAMGEEDSNIEVRIVRKGEE